MTKFLVINCKSALKAVLGRPLVGELKAVMFIHNLMVKFPTPEGIDCLQGELREARECYNWSITTIEKGKWLEHTLMVMARPIAVEKLELRTKDDEKNTSLIDELVKIKVGNLENCQSLKVGKNLWLEIKEALEVFLMENLDVFAWTHSNMVYNQKWCATS